MQFLIVGSGAIGGFVGSRLHEAGLDVTFLVRPDRKRQLITRGLTLLTPYGRFRRPVAAVLASEINDTYDVVVVASRAHEFETALALARPALGSSTLVVPMVEGPGHTSIASQAGMPTTLSAMLESRVTLDADGVLTQRPPVAELTIGEVDPEDKPHALIISELLKGRGLMTSYCADIRARKWERFTYLAAGIALSIRMKAPFRDALRQPYGNDMLVKLLGEGFAIGQAAGFSPCPVRARAYARAFMLDARPIMPPPNIAEGGRTGDEAAFLLAEMIGIGRQIGLCSPEFALAWRKATMIAEGNSTCQSSAVPL